MAEAPNDSGLHDKASRQKAFLEAYIELGMVKAACDRIGISRWTAYNWKLEPGYAQSFADADAIVAQNIRDEVYRRAVQGVEKPITVAGERTVVTEYSDTLLRLLAQAKCPEFKNALQITGSEGGPLKLSIQQFDEILKS